MVECRDARMERGGWVVQHPEQAVEHTLGVFGQGYGGPKPGYWVYGQMLDDMNVVAVRK